MKEALEAKGWKIYWECKSPCYKQYFNHVAKVGFEIRVRIRNKTFSIIQNNMVIAGPFWEYQLEEKLEKHGL